MSRNFNVGDRVVIVKAYCRPELVGKVTTIIEAGDDFISTRDHGVYFGYGVDIYNSRGDCLVAGPEQLRPYGDFEAASWADCAWQPKKETERHGHD